MLVLASRSSKHGLRLSRPGTVTPLMASPTPTARYCPNFNKTFLGHLAQQHQNVRSTKPKVPKHALSPDLPPKPPSTAEEPSNQVFVKVYPLSKIYTDNTGCFPVRARSGNQYVMITFHSNINLILQQSFKSKDQVQPPPHGSLQCHYVIPGSPRSCS
jgi:hypothetical protein